MTAHGWSRHSTRITLVPMNPAMSETATLHESTEAEFRPTARERLGIAAFVLVALVATATWIVLLVWGAVKLATAF